MSRRLLRLALVPVTFAVLGSCRDVPTALANLRADALLSTTATLPQAIDATIQQIFTKGGRTSVDARWRNVTTKLSAGQTKVAYQMYAELVDWIENNPSQLAPLTGETKAHAAARLVLYMSLYAYRDSQQPMPAIPEMGSDAVLKLISPTADATVVTPDNKAGIALPKGAVTEPTVLVIYADAEPDRARCAGPLDTELCQYPGFYHFEAFPHQRLTAPARVGICGPELALARMRLAHGLPSATDRIAGGTITDAIEILPAANVADFLACGIGGLTLTFSEFAPVDPVPQYSRYCPTETERTLTYADLDSAIAHVPQSNVVVVCDGTWPTNEADVNKAITIRSETPGGATLAQPADATASQAVLRIDGIASGEVRVANLSIQFKSLGIRAIGTFDQVVLDSARLTGPVGIPGTAGVRLDGSSVATAHVQVIRSRFTNSYFAIWGREPVAVDTYESRFEEVWWAGVILVSTPNGTAMASVTGQSMQKADVIGNTFVNVPKGGVGAAVSLQAAGDHLIQNNQMTNTNVFVGTTGMSSGVFVTRSGVVLANTRPVRIRGNVVTGYAPAGDPAVPATWGFFAAFRIINGIAGVSDSVSHNSATAAFIGLDVAAPAGMIAFDNTVSGMYVAIRKNGASAVSITRNDFTGYMYPITASAPVPPGNPALSNGSVACNWWGSSAAPAPLGPNVNPGSYAPWATTPIANQPGVSCP